MFTATRTDRERPRAPRGAVIALAAVIGVVGFIAAPAAVALVAEQPTGEHVLVLAPGTTPNH